MKKRVIMAICVTNCIAGGVLSANVHPHPADNRALAAPRMTAQGASWTATGPNGGTASGIPGTGWQAEGYYGGSAKGIGDLWAATGPYKGTFVDQPGYGWHAYSPDGDINAFGRLGSGWTAYDSLEDQDYSGQPLILTDSGWIFAGPRGTTASGAGSGGGWTAQGYNGTTASGQPGSGWTAYSYDGNTAVGQPGSGWTGSSGETGGVVVTWD